METRCQNCGSYLASISKSQYCLSCEPQLFFAETLRSMASATRQNEELIFYTRVTSFLEDESQKSDWGWLHIDRGGFRFMQTEYSTPSSSAAVDWRDVIFFGPKSMPVKLREPYFFSNHGMPLEDYPLGFSIVYGQKDLQRVEIWLEVGLELFPDLGRDTAKVMTRLQNASDFETDRFWPVGELNVVFKIESGKSVYMDFDTNHTPTELCAQEYENFARDLLATPTDSYRSWYLNAGKFTCSGPFE